MQHNSVLQTLSDQRSTPRFGIFTKLVDWSLAREGTYVGAFLQNRRVPSRIVSSRYSIDTESNRSRLFKFSHIEYIFRSVYLHPYINVDDCLSLLQLFGLLAFRCDIFGMHGAVLHVTWGVLQNVAGTTDVVLPHRILTPLVSKRRRNWYSLNLLTNVFSIISMLIYLKINA